MPNDKIIDAVIKAEVGPYPDGGYTNKPNDPGGRTQYGISELSNPEAWADDKVTEEEARAIYMRRYVEGPNFHRIADQRLRHQLVDFGVHSGPAIATQKLQEILKVKADGILGPITLGAVEEVDGVWLNNQLAVARIKMLGRIVQKRPSQLSDLFGWLSRATEFILP